MRHLEIVFTKSKKKFAVFSKLIMIYTNRPYSHVARKTYIGTNKRELYFQSSEGKVNYEYTDVFHKKHEIVKSYTLEVSDELYQKIADSCLVEAGKDYGFMQNLGIVLVDLKLTKTNPWKHGRVCSELLYVTILKQLVTDLEYNKDTIKPSDIENIIVENFTQEDGIWKLNKS